MEFETSEFFQHLKDIKPGTAQKEIVSFADRFAFNDGHIYSYNDEISLSKKVDIDFNCLIDAKTIYDLVSQINDKTISVSLENRDKDIVAKETSEMDGEEEVPDTNMRIKGKKFEAVIPTISSATLPRISFVDDENSKFYAVPDNFSTIINATLVSVSTDLSSPALTTIHWMPDYIESCDNYRLTRFNIKTKGIPEKGILLSPGSVKQLLSYKPKSFCISDDKEWIGFKTNNNCIFSCRVHKLNYPPVDAVLEMTDGEKIKFPSKIIPVLNRAIVFANTKSDVKGTEQAKITIQNKTILVETSKVSRGIFKESLRANIQGDFSFIVHISSILAILKNRDYVDMIINAERTKLKLTNADINMTHIIALL